MDSKMLPVALLPLIVWIGLWLYLVMVDRKLARIEAGKEQDDL